MERCPKGYSIGATGLYLRTEDMVKLGILYLNKGMWKETRVLSEEWVDMVISNEYEFSYQYHQNNHKQELFQ